MYIPEHLHTSGSVLDGACDIKKLVAKATSMDLPALGITDHGNMIKAYEFQQECLSKGIKPIIGCEFYVGEPDTQNTFHLVLLAKNNRGLRNLYQLNAYAWRDNFYKKPRITFEQLEIHHEGLICTTACIGSEFGELFINDKYEEFLPKLMDYKELFGDDLYLELQANHIPKQKDYNKYLINLSHNLNISLTVSTDAHYVDKNDAKAHDVMLAMQVQKKVNDPNRFRFSGEDFYIQPEEKLKQILSDMGIYMCDINDAIANTVSIADKCGARIRENLDLTPHIGVINEHQTLCEHCNVGFQWRVRTRGLKGSTDEIERIKYELKVIKDKGYSGYFLIVEDYIKWAKDKGIYVGSGRGSAAGSAVAYILGITNINPFKYGLLFERFLNPERQTEPDIDCDFDYERREEVIQYVKNKYGADKVARIIAEGTLSCKAVVRKVLSAFDFDQKYINKICKSIPDMKDLTLSKAVDASEEFKGYMLQHFEQFNIMLKLEGLTDHVSTHAAGIMICNQPVENVVPCMTDAEDRSMLMTQWNMDILHDIHAYKFDFLGLKTLTILRKAIENIQYNTGKMINLDSINLEDRGIYEVLNSGDLSGVFQFDAPAGKRAIEQIHPTKFDDIIAGVSICRPGVKEAQLYINNKSLGNSYPVPDYWDLVADILEPTYGAIVYQEQTMLLMNKLTGGRWTLGKADKMRKVKNLEEYRVDFVRCCFDNGIDNDTANNIYSRFDLGYTFNKSHAACYAVVAAQCAWLKYYYRPEFMAAIMSMDVYAPSDTKQMPEFVAECRKYNIKLLPPDINKSERYFFATNDGVMFPLNCIKNVGNNIVKAIIDYRRNHGSFENFNQVVNSFPKKTVNKKTMRSLIKAGCFDDFNENRNRLLVEFSNFREEETLLEDSYTWCDEILYAYDKEMFGTYIKKHPLSGLCTTSFNLMQDGFEYTTAGQIITYKVIQDKNGNDMAFIKLENACEMFECTVFSREYRRFRDLLSVGRIVSIRGRKQTGSFIANEFNVLRR